MKPIQQFVFVIFSLFVLEGCAYFDGHDPQMAQRPAYNDLQTIEVERLDAEVQESVVQRPLVFDEGRVQVFLLDEPPREDEKNLWRLQRIEVFPFEDGPSGSSFWADKFDFLLPWKS